MTKWVVAIVLAGSAVIAVRSGGCLNSSKDPDEKLASRFEEICEIATDNIDTPVDGVRDLGRYLGKHLGDMYGEFGGTLQLIENVRDDAAHDDRARLARERWVRPWQSCGRDWMRFWEAVDRDPVASELVERANERFQRTIEILFGNDDVKLRDLPLRLRELI
jgi:hypothetical protein